MKAIIIGAAGFVGHYLAAHLRGCGYELTLTKLPQESLSAEGSRVVDLDILDPTAVEKVLLGDGYDHLYHLAAQSSVALSWANPALTIDVNVKGTANVLEAVRKLGAKPRVLLIGSGEEYGAVREDECPVGEQNALRPANIYAATKACANMLGKLYAHAYGLDVVLVRAFNHIGPRQLPQFVVADFCRQVAEIEAGKREPVLRVGNLAAKRDFTDVRDVVRAYELLMRLGEAGETYNVGSGQAVAIQEILDRLLALSSCAIHFEVDESRLRPSDSPVIEADTRKLVSRTGWRRQISLDQTLADCLDYYRSGEL